MRSVPKPATIVGQVPLLVSVVDTAQLLSVSEETVRRMLDAGVLVERRVGRRRLVLRESVTAVANGSKWNASATPPARRDTGVAPRGALRKGGEV